MSDIKKKLVQLLSSNEKYQNEDKTLNLYRLVKDIDSLNPELIKFLSEIKDVKIREIIFSKISDITILNQNLLLQIVKSKEYVKNSTTFYSNKIGMVSENDEVVLNYPFKDCILVGGMDKEDEKNKTEVFFHELLDKDKVDSLFSPKIFCHIKKYGKDDNSNLVICGNNLIALHSLAQKYKGKINVIYIDPPYYFDKKKTVDSFAYNSNFKFSSWLTFMKNRLEIASKLLSENGVIFISLDQDGIHHLKLLCDEVFGRKNCVDFLTVVNNLKGRSDDDYFATSNEFCLCYAKNKDSFVLRGLPLNDEDLKEYKFKDEISEFKPVAFKKTGKNSLRTDRPNMFYPIYFNKETKKLSLEKKKGYDIEFIPKTPEGNDGCWRWGKETFLEKNETELIVSEVKEDGLTINVKMRLLMEDGSPRTKKPKTLFLDSRYDSGSGTKMMKTLFGSKEIFANPKPLEFIKDLILIAYGKDATVLDFFAGSGTTGHAVLSLNKDDGGSRRFILIEQMEYAKNLTAERIKRAIEKEELGSGFTYCELLKEPVKDQIKKCKTNEEIFELINTNFSSGYFQYIDSQENLIKELQKEKKIEDVKKTLLENYFDHNREYVRYSDISRIKVSKEDLEFNKKFYGDSDE